MISMQKLRGAVGGSRVETRRRILASLVLAVCLLAIPQGAGAVNNTWTGTLDTSYTVITNWTTATTPPGPGEVAIFLSPLLAGAIYTVDSGAALTVGVFSFTGTTANPYTINLGANTT